MTSFADGFALLAYAAAGLVVPAPSAAPAEWNARVAERVAEAWRVPAADVTLEWGRARADWPANDVPFELRGKGGDGWFVVVVAPLAERAQAVKVRAGVPDSVWVATRALASGEVVAETDVRTEVRVRWGAPDGRAPQTVVGAKVRRPIAAGAVVGWPAVVAPPLVAAGTPVTLAWTQGAVRVSLTGVALNSANHGEPVRARVDGRNARLVGTAIAPAMVALGAGSDAK